MAKTKLVQSEATKNFLVEQGFEVIEEVPNTFNPNLIGYKFIFSEELVMAINFFERPLTYEEVKEFISEEAQRGVFYTVVNHTSLSDEDCMFVINRDKHKIFRERNRIRK